MYNFHSLPDNNPKWKDEFIKLEWVGGDWGTLFRRSFGRVSESGVNSIDLTDAKEAAYNLIRGGRRH